jgi:integrase
MIHAIATPLRIRRIFFPYGPLTAVLTHAAKRDWCTFPKFDKPAEPKGKTIWLAPADALRLIEAAAPHLRPLILFMLCTGARVSEALELDWSDVDLPATKVVLRDTKNGTDRPARLPPAAVTALVNLPGRQGRVFRRDDGQPYADRERQEGGQIKTAFATACRRAGLVAPLLDGRGQPILRDGEPEMRPAVTPHDLRHSWATWFYALCKDLLLLKDEGGWRTLRMVERYAHLMPSELVSQISNVWGASHPRIGVLPTGGTIVPLRSDHA